MRIRVQRLMGDGEREAPPSLVDVPDTLSSSSNGRMGGERVSTSGDRLGRIIDVMEMVQSDCEQEAMSIDGKPFTGGVVAEQLGNLLAEVSAVAKAVQTVALILKEEG